MPLDPAATNSRANLKPTAMTQIDSSMKKLDPPTGPSISHLRAFASVAAYGSFSAGAAALGVSQSSVSHAIARLEAALGGKLMVRTSRVLTLTPAGSALLPAVRSILEAVDRLPRLAKEQRRGRELRLLVPPAFASSFLIDRMPAWQRVSQGVALSLARHFLEYEAAQDQVDAAILYGRGTWKNAESIELGGGALVVVGQKGYAAIGDIERGRVLRRHLIEHVQLPDAWEAVANAEAVSIEGAAPGITFDLFSQVLEAAERGMGLAVVPLFVARQSLASGKVVALFSGRTVSYGMAYYLAYEAAARYNEDFVRFRDWLLAEARSGLN
jgi:LysR family transcriptional regulator, glycine cleavage system transcriptional activator